MKKLLLLTTLCGLLSTPTVARCFNDQMMRDITLEGFEEKGFSCQFLNEDKAFTLENKPQIYQCDSDRKTVTVQVESVLMYEPGRLGPCFSARTVIIK